MAELTALSDRRVRIIVTAPLGTNGKVKTSQVLTIEELRVAFKVSKTLDKGPNGAEVKIYNLAEKTRSSLQQKGAGLVIEAGYLSNLAIIYKGDVRTVDHIRDGADWVTKIEAGDGERAFCNVRCADSFAGGSKALDVVKSLAGRLGYEVPDLTKVPGLSGREFSQGYAAVGKASKELDKVLKGAGYTWSVQDGKLQVLKRDGHNFERIVQLGPDSGLIGSPEYGTPEKKDKPPVLKVKCLLSPEVKPGGRVALVSERHNGIHVVKKLEHEGDTHDTAWTTSFECAASADTTAKVVL